MDSNWNLPTNAADGGLKSTMDSNAVPVEIDSVMEENTLEGKNFEPAREDLDNVIFLKHT